jgi:hypothetical protein
MMKEGGYDEGRILVSQSFAFMKFFDLYRYALVAAALGSSITRDYAGDCGGAGCAWQEEGRVAMPRAKGMLRKNLWMNHLLDQGGTVLQVDDECSCKPHSLKAPGFSTIEPIA